MIIIYKYPFLISTTKIQMPTGAELLSVQCQHDQPMLWAAVNTDNPVRARKIAVYATGQRIQDHHNGKYFGTFQMAGGALVWHLFDLGE